MMTHAVLALLTRPAMIAAFAGFIVLSLAFIAIRRARRRRAARTAAQREARRLVGLLRHCPRFTRNEDRRLAAGFAEKLHAITAEHGFTLHDVGTRQAEIDKILYLVRVDVVADPRSSWPNALKRVLNVNEPGTPAIPINAVQSPADHATEQVLFSATFSVDELIASGDTSNDAGAPGQETVEIIVEEPVNAEPGVPPDPITALKALDEDVLDELIDARILAIQVEPKE